MTTITDVQGMFNTAGAARSASGSVPADTQERFLTLLVTQMKNQDPLNPMDNAQVTSQMAQLSTVSGIEQLNKTLNAMAAASSAQQTLQAAALVGRPVMVEGNQLNYGGQPVRFGVDLPASVDHLQLTITDSTGKVVEQIDAGSHPQGVLALEWSGSNEAGEAMPPGTYTLSVKAASGSTAVTGTPLVSGVVQSVGAGSNGISLQVGGRGDVALTDVKRFM